MGASVSFVYSSNVLKHLEDDLGQLAGGEDC